MSVVKDELKQTLSNLSSTSLRHVYNALVQIRTKVIKSPSALKKSISNGLIPKLLKILDNADTEESKPKNADVTLSILGNLCMEQEYRTSVVASSGIESLARHLLESSVESIQNRSVRGLANLALTAASISRIINLDVAPRIVKLLQDTTSKECQLTYCRAFRLLGRSTDGQRKVTEAGAVLAVAKLLKNEDAEVASCSLRTILELIQLGCNSNFARQIIGANILDKLILLTECDNSTDAHRALTTIFLLVNQPDARAAIGSAGGIQFFIRLLTEDKDITNINKIAIINALCLCGKEAVNRVKIREMGGLQIYLNALKDKKFSKVHDRIISGFVCFLYDDASIDVLLENSFVEVLLQHFQRCCDFTSTIEEISFGKKESFDESGVKSTSYTKEEQKRLLGSKSLDEYENEKREHDSPFKSPGKLKRSVSDSIFTDSPSCSNKANKAKDLEQISETFQDDTPSSSTFPKDQTDRHKFSIDSPTYEINTEWNLENYATQTCKQNFDQQDNPRTPSPPLSPMSNDTYYSPAQSSPTYSPPRSPESMIGSPEISPGSPGFGLDREYHPVLSVPYSYRSPEASRIDWSPDESGCGTNAESLCYSSSEEDTVGCDRKEDQNEEEDSEEGETKEISGTPERSSSPEPEDSGKLVEDRHKTDREDLESKDIGTEKIVRYGKRTLSLRSPSYQLVESCPKRKKTGSKRTDIMKTTEHNILILLSRISVKTDPTSHLLTPPVVSCMLDYLFYVHQPHSRCVRTLSRLFKNPQCFSKCLLLAVPLTVYQKIILDSDGIDNESYENFSQRSSRSRRSSRLSTSSDDSFSGGQLTSLENSFQGSSTSSKDNALDFTHGLLASPTSPRSEADITFKVGQSPMSQNAAELCISNVGQSGLSLLKDLSFTAESPYGRGVITYLLSRRSREDKLYCTISLLFLCWGSVMQKQYLVKCGILSSVLDLLKTQLADPGPIFMAIVSGLTFICKLNSFPLNLKKEKMDIFKSSSSENGSCVCVYENLTADVTFRVDSKVISANRENLAQSSAMFLAMLEGHYSESSQTEIKIQDTTAEALEFVLHYLQGCSSECPVLKKVEAPSNRVTVDFILESLALADRFLLADLAYYLKVAITSNHLNPDSCAAVFEFASFHEFSPLASDCVKILLCSPVSLSEKSQALAQMMTGECAELFMDTLRAVLTEGTE